jgi:hypothetical protein
MLEDNYQKSIPTDGLFLRIKADLPNFPDEVLAQWIYPFANKIGWPPEKSRDPSRWKNLLGATVVDWSMATWALEETDLTQLPFSYFAADGFKCMYRNYVNNESNEYDNLKKEGGAERLKLSIKYICEHGRFPKPIIFRKIHGEFEVVDGNHRLLAWYIVRESREKIKALSPQQLDKLNEMLGKKLEEEKIADVPDTQLVWIASFP